MSRVTEVSKKESHTINAALEAENRVPFTPVHTQMVRVRRTCISAQPLPAGDKLRWVMNNYTVIQMFKIKPSQGSSPGNKCLCLRKDMWLKSLYCDRQERLQAQRADARGSPAQMHGWPLPAGRRHRG